MRPRITKCKNVQQVVELDQIIFNDSPPVTVKDCEWWVVTVDGAVVGFAGLMITDHGAFLTRAGLLKKYRGFGIQKKLIKIRESYARSCGMPVIVTYTSHVNCPSMNSLIKCGFKTYEPHYAWVGREDVVYWRKSLR